MQKLLISLLLAGWLSPTWAAERIFLNLVVNGVPQGDVEALYDERGYWLSAQSLQSAGLHTIEGISQIHEGSLYYLADQLHDMRSRLLASEQILYLDADAEEFGRRQIPLSQQRDPRWPAPSPLSAYLTYDAALLHQSQLAGLEYQFMPTINVSGYGWNLRSEHSYYSGASAKPWARLRTTLDYVDPEAMVRATAGDLTPRLGALGFSQNLAGIGISRAFELQPDFESMPAFQSQTAVTQPSTAEIYLNGQRIKTLDLQPGIYEFSDLRYFSGLQNVDIVIRDRFGGTQTTSIPYYFDDSLLRAGLTDYSHNIGMRRVNGSFDRYDGWAYSLYQRYGLTDWLTVGAQASGHAGEHSYGALATLRLGWYGTLAGVLSWVRRSEGADGNAQVINYRYNHDSFSVYANLQRQSRDYWTRTVLLDDAAHVKWSANVGASVGSATLGSLSMEYGRQQGDNAESTANRYMLNYSFSPWRNASISAQLRLNDGMTQTWSGFLNLSLYFDGGHSLYAGGQYQNERMQYSTTLSKSSPAGEGWGYSLSAQQQTDSTDYIAWLEHKMAFGQASVSGINTVGGKNRQHNFRLGWRGSLAYADQEFRLTRPIDDAFAVARVDGVGNVGILQNGSQIGKTDEEGVLFLPDVPSFSYQQIGIAQNDLPIEYTIDRLQKNVLSGDRDGRVVHFATRRLHAVSGLILRADGSPLGGQRLQVAGQTEVIDTALDGRFYSETLRPGIYDLAGEDCHLSLMITESDAVTTDLGTLSCQE